MHGNLAYENMSPSADTAVNALSQVHNSLRVPYVGCTDVYGLTVADTMEIALLNRGGCIFPRQSELDIRSTCYLLSK